MEKLQKFLSKDWLLYFAPIIYFIGIVGMDIVYMSQDLKGGIVWFGGHLFIAAMVLIACLSYKKHNKNVMKAVLGAMLAFLCANSIDNALNYIVYFQPTVKIIVSLVLSVLIALSSIVFFINHLVLASDHKSNPKMINFNMITCICCVVFSIAWGVFAASLGTRVVDYLYAIFWIFFAIGSIILAINIETKIDYFKQQRDEKNQEAEKEASAEE